jgi:hypothetical protein
MCRIPLTLSPVHRVERVRNHAISLHAQHSQGRPHRLLGVIAGIDGNRVPDGGDKLIRVDYAPR